MKFFFSFDVESVGLYGPPFAVGWVLMDEERREHDHRFLACPMESVLATRTPISDTDLEWVRANVIKNLPTVENPAYPDRPGLYYANCLSLKELCTKFWDAWKDARDMHGATLLTDCGFPVETNFLLTVRRIIGLTSMAESPYPVLDVATALAARGLNPLGNYTRLPAEEPAHNPLCDAWQSARIYTGLLADFEPEEKPS